MEFETKGKLKEKIMIFCYEFFGTFILVQGVNYSGGKPLIVGLTLYMNILLFESVCGAHFNPAVTVAVYFMEIKNAAAKNLLWVLLFWLAQFSGALVGALFSISTIPDDMLPALHRGAYKTQDGTTTKYYEDYSVFMVELIYTFMFVLIVTYQKYDPAMLTPGSFLDAVACGLALYVSVTMASSVSGGCINPAVGLALTLCAKLYDIRNGDESSVGFEKDLWIYIVAPLLGGLLAAVFYKYVHIPIDEAGEMKTAAAVADDEEPANGEAELASKSGPPQ